MPVLADIFSAGNTLKRRFKDFAANPGAFLETEVNFRNQKAGEFNTLQDLATQGDINKMRGLPVTPDQQAAELRIRDIVAGAYNPIGMTAYHGSPYLFPRLDPKKIGMGEGNQAYGVGAGYTAEARPVAEKYALDISNRDMANQGRLNAHANAKRLADLAGDPKYAADDVRFVLETNPDHPQKALLTKTLGYLESGSYKEPLKNTGYLYKGDIPDEIIPKFLDYDAPLKNQSPEVQALAKSLGMDLEDLGGDLLGKVGKNVKGTLQMQDAGIKGIKYLDQGSRGQGKGTSNFIPFSPDDFKIQEINDEPLEAWLKSGRLQVDESDPLMQFLGQK
jgi:hypothetical protein